MAGATSIMRAHQIVLGRVDAALAPLSLTFARYEALALLHFSRRGSLPLGRMGERLMVHPTSVTNAVDRLEKQGLVRRVPDSGDRRRVLAEITAEGRELVEKATRVLEGIRFGMGEISDSDATRVAAALERLRVDAEDF